MHDDVVVVYGAAVGDAVGIEAVTPRPEGAVVGASIKSVQEQRHIDPHLPPQSRPLSNSLNLAGVVAALK